MTSYEGIRMKRKLASFVVDHRRAVFILMLLIAAVSAFLLTKVEINEDLTRYLPDKSAMKQGIDIMADEFPEAQTSQTIRVMFDRLKPEEKEGIRARLQSIPYVTDVAWQADNPDYNRDDRTLFVLSTDAGYKSAEMKAIKRALDRDFQGYEIAWHDDDVGMPEVPAWILLSGVAAILLILLAMCGSWIEPFLFLAGIGFAVIITQGTNIFQGSVSTVTASMSAILQLVLSMDYSIILSNRFKQERAKNEDIAASMKTAVINSFSSIVSSGMTTVAGLLMLLFMSFKIGMDLGIVLAKGVFLSMFCVLVIMPGILISCDGLIRKTTKKSFRIPTKALASFSNKNHAVITVVFTLVMAGALFLQQQTGIVYTLQREDTVADVFPADNTMVLVYQNDDEPTIPGIYRMLEADSDVKSVTCYYSALATPYTAEEMVKNMPEMQEGMKLDRDLLSMIYYLRYAGDQSLKMTVGEFLTFLSDHVAGNEMFEAYMSVDQREMLSKIGSYAGMVSLFAGNDPMTPKQMADMFSSFSSDINEESLELAFLYKAGIEDGDPQWTMTMEELFNFLYDTVQHDPWFSPLLGEDAKAALSDAKEQLSAGKAQLAGEKHSRMIITTRYPDEDEKTFRFIDRLSSACDKEFKGKYYIIGNSAMNLEMSRSFGSEYLFITLLTAAVIFLIVSLSTRSLMIPLILVLIVQTGVFITVASIGLFGGSIYYLALLIVQCILMGATIDYGILFTNYYTENRRNAGTFEAVRKTYEGAIHTIATSGLILVIVPSVVGRFFQDPTITAIVDTIAIGSLAAIALILVCLPGILITFDKLVSRKPR